MIHHSYLPHTLRIGRKSIAVRDLSDASCAYQDHLWTMQSRGAKAAPPAGRITIDGTEYQIDRDARVYRDGVCIMEAA